MNRIKKIILVIFLLVLVYFGYRILIKEHEVSYTIDKYRIKEHFYINKNHYYDLIISKDKLNYTYTFITNSNQKYTFYLIYIKNIVIKLELIFLKVLEEL